MVLATVQRRRDRERLLIAPCKFEKKDFPIKNTKFGDIYR